MVQVSSVWIAAGALSAPAVPAGALTLTSPDIVQGKRIADAQVYNEYGCSGRNVSPALSWSNVPAGTKSFAIFMQDPDAPTSHGWMHWVVYDIPAEVTSLPAGAGDPKKNLMPAGAVQGRSDFGTAGYGGPCPPPGKPHHYYVRLFALNVQKLEAPPDATAALIGSYVTMHTLGSAALMGLYGR